MTGQWTLWIGEPPDGVDRSIESPAPSAPLRHLDRHRPARPLACKVAATCARGQRHRPAAITIAIATASTFLPIRRRPPLSTIERPLRRRCAPRCSDLLMRIRGIIHRTDLPGHDISQKQLAEWLRSGAVQSMQPWYLTSEAPADLVSILRTGTRPTCLDAAALHGLWVPPSLKSVHVFRPRQGRGRRSAGRGRTTAPEAVPVPKATPVRRRKGKIVWGPEKTLPLSHHGPALRTWPSAHPVPDLSLVLEHAARCLPLSQAATLFESALDRKELAPREAERVISALPQRLRRGLARIRSDAGSGTETTVRWWFESLGVAVSTQVSIAGVGRVDLLLGQSWVIECDSREFHDNPEQYARDRARDLALQALGYRVTRLTWKQVFVTWASTQERLLSILRRADHHRPPDFRLSLTA